MIGFGNLFFLMVAFPKIHVVQKFVATVLLPIYDKTTTTSAQCRNYSDTRMLKQRWFLLMYLIGVVKLFVVRLI